MMTEIETEEQAEQDLDEALRALMTHEQGKRVIFWVLEQAAIYRDPFAGNAEATNYLLGAQSIGRRIIQRLDSIDARIYPHLLLEMADMMEMKRAAAQNNEDDDDVE